jgi:hypothetical protein
VLHKVSTLQGTYCSSEGNMSDEEKHFLALSAACVLDHVSGRLFGVVCVLWVVDAEPAARSERPADDSGADELGNPRDAGDTRVAASNLDAAARQSAWALVRAFLFVCVCFVS